MISNIINYSTYVVALFLEIQLSFSIILAYVAGLIFSYFGNKIWVFHNHEATKFLRLVLFLTVYAVGGVVMVFFTTYSISHLGLNNSIAWFIGAIFAVINNFVGNKYVVFRAYK